MARGKRSAAVAPFRTAAECIDFTLTCPSIFGRSKSLAENTLRRIVRGLVKFVLESADPFIVQVNHSGPEFRGQRLAEPMPVISSKHGYGLVVPYFYDRYDERPGGPSRSGIGAHAGQEPRCRGVDRPLGAITGTANGANLVLPYLVRHRFGDVGWTGVGSPLQTICAQGNHFSLIAPHLIQFNGEKGGETRGQPLRWPLNTVPTENRFGLAAHALAPWLYTNVIGQQAGRRCDVPAGTITTVHNKFQLVTPYMVSCAHSKTTGRAQYHFPLSDPFRTITASNDKTLVTPYMVRCAHGESSASGKRWGAGERDLLLPLPTVTGSKDFAAVTPFLAEVANSKWGVGCRHLAEPMPTITAKPDGGSWAAVAPLLTKFYGMGDNVLPADEPVATITSRDRFGLAEVSMAGWVVKHYGGPREILGQSIDRPLGTVTAVDHHCLGSAWLTNTPTPAVPSLADLVGGPTDDPAINAGFWRVYVLLRRFLGDEAPLPFVHKRDADGNLQTYLIHDIGMRMLTPRELLNAQFGPELAKDYILTGTRESQVAKIGNSVPPYLGAAVVRANWHDGEEHDGEVAA